MPQTIPVYRMAVLRTVLLMSVVVLIGRLYQLQLVDSDARRYGSANVTVTTTRYVMVSSRRGEILANDGKSRLAESVPIFSIAVLPGSLPPEDSQRRTYALGKLAQITGITSTLTFSPSLNVQRTTEVGSKLTMNGFMLADPPEPTSWDTAPERTLEVIGMTEVYSDMLTLQNPIDELIQKSNARGYETVIVKEDISQALALVINENNTHLPGVVVVKDYRRRYPLSASLPSLSHLLGYIGRINTCELAGHNPASSWVTSLKEVISHVPGCGIITKQIVPHLLGMPPYKNDDRIGKEGLEGSYEQELRGRMGIQTIGVDALERPVSAARTWQSVQNGYNLVLTIDLDFQRQVETILHRWINEAERRRTSAEGHKRNYKPITNGVAVVLNARDGRVLAMVSLPTYDNNVWVDRTRTGELQNLLRPDDPAEQEMLDYLAPLTNRAIAGQYPPGSSIKPVIGAAALQKQVIASDTLLRDPGRIILAEGGGHTFELPNSVRRDNGEISLSDALMVSSNVFFASIGGGNDLATNLGQDAHIISGLNITGVAEGLEWFGFGRRTGIRLFGESAGRVPTPNWKAHSLREPWTTGDTYNTSIGQGYLEVTPLQLTVATAAVANNGLVYRPQIVQAIIDDSGNIVQEFQPQLTTETPVDDQYLAVIREGMRRSVTEGINRAARDQCSGLSVGGKTGTAEFGPVILTEDNRLTRQSHAWFAGFAPYDNPEIAVVVLIEGAGDLDDGSATLAVPTVTQIMQAYFKVTPPAEQPWFCPELPQ